MIRKLTQLESWRLLHNPSWSNVFNVNTREQNPSSADRVASASGSNIIKRSLEDQKETKGYAEGKEPERKKRMGVDTNKCLSF